MRRFKLLPILALMATAMSTAQAQTDLMVQPSSALEKTSSTAGPSSETDLIFSGHIEALDTFYGKDYFSCWNDGVAAKCGRTPNLLEGSSWVRLDCARDLNDTWTLIFRGQIGTYENNAWYTVSKAANTGANYTDALDLRAEVEDTWLGIKHSDFGTIRAGRGLNPYQLALEGDGTTDLGGGEMLKTMVAYDSP